MWYIVFCRVIICCVTTWYGVVCCVMSGCFVMCCQFIACCAVLCYMCYSVVWYVVLYCIVYFNRGFQVLKTFLKFNKLLSFRSYCKVQSRTGGSDLKSQISR